MFCRFKVTHGRCRAILRLKEIHNKVVKKIRAQRFVARIMCFSHFISAAMLSSGAVFVQFLNRYQVAQFLNRCSEFLNTVDDSCQRFNSCQLSCQGLSRINKSHLRLRFIKLIGKCAQRNFCVRIQMMFQKPSLYLPP